MATGAINIFLYFDSIFDAFFRVVPGGLTTKSKPTHDHGCYKNFYCFDLIFNAFFEVVHMVMVNRMVENIFGKTIWLTTYGSRAT